MVGERAEDVQRLAVRRPLSPALGVQLLDLRVGSVTGRPARVRRVSFIRAVCSRPPRQTACRAPGRRCQILRCRATAIVAARGSVLDDEVAVAFLDRRPVFKGHVLVVPRQHVVTLPTSIPATSTACSAACSESRARMPDALGCDGTFVAINNVVSQSVAHLHVHVVPRRRKDGLRGFFWPRVRYESDAEADDYALRLRQALAT